MTDSTKLFDPAQDRLPLTSTDLTDALLAQLRETAPQVFSEGHVDFAKLQAALNTFLDTLGYRYWDESANPAYRLFLG